MPALTTPVTPLSSAGVFATMPGMSEPRMPRDLGALVLLLALAIGGTQLLRTHSDSRDGERLRALVRPGDVQMLSSETCIYCERARRWLDARQIPFSECLIERDADCMREYQARGGLGTPTFVVRGHTVRGFDREAMARLLGNSR